MTDEQIANALQAADWHGAPIGNKALLQAAINALLSASKPAAPQNYERHDPDTATAPFLSFIPDAKRDELIGALLESLEKSDQRETDFFMVRSFIGGLGLLAARFAPAAPAQSGEAVAADVVPNEIAELLTEPCWNLSRRDVSDLLKRIGSILYTAPQPSQPVEAAVVLDDERAALRDLFREALSWGMTFGKMLVESQQWYEMRDKQVDQFLARAASPQATATQPAQTERALTAAEIGEFESTVTEFEDCGETSTDYAKLIGWTHRGLLECTNFRITSAGRALLTAAQPASGADHAD
jgi:hypothetical protein